MDISWLNGGKFEYSDTFINKINQQSELNSDYTSEPYKKNDKEQSCPICCEEFNAEGVSNLLDCPQCKNSIHKECMEIWLTKNDNCVYCRKEWADYILI